jgi:serine/threonine protein kinase
MMNELQPTDPDLIGPYRLRARLGAGGMGRVYYGLSPGGRPVAVKVIRADLAADPEFRARFRREVAVARSVSGLFTAPVIDADADGPVPWLATEYVRGPSLADAVSQHGPLPAASVLALARGLAEGLSAIHAAGIVHRDLKPSNVLLAADGPRVIDFGISRATEASGLTSTGLVVGSPGFMSPEQAEGLAVGPPSDVFSLGAVLAFAATGQGPFGTGSTPALVYRVVHSTPRLECVPAEVRPLVERCLAKDPGRRPTADGLLAGAAYPGTGWLPEPVTRAFSLAGGPVTVTAQVPGPAVPGPAVPGPAVPGAGGPEGGRPGRAGRHSWRSRRRPLAVAAVVAALAGAGITAGFTMAGTSAHAAQSGRQISGVSGVSGVVPPPTAPGPPGSPPASYPPAPAAPGTPPESAPAYTPPSSTPTATAPPSSTPPSPVHSPSPVTSPPTAPPASGTPTSAAPGGY